MLRILEPIAIMLAAWLKGLVATVPLRKWRIGRAVNLSYYSGETLGSSPARLSIAGTLDFVEGKRNVVGVPLDANPEQLLLFG